MKAPRKSRCVVCDGIIWPRQTVRIMSANSLSSPLTRLRHDECVPTRHVVPPRVDGVTPLGETT